MRVCVCECAHARAAALTLKGGASSQEENTGLVCTVLAFVKAVGRESQLGWGEGWGLV